MIKDILTQRTLLLAKASNNVSLQTMLYEKCRRDIIYWFNHFCWTFDPRKKQAVQPFILYPYQKDFVLDLQQKIKIGEDVLIEKSRDMGISWLVLLVFQHFWLFEKGSHFLVGSRKADMVDQKGDLSSLIEKFRFNLSYLPQWMMPEKFNPTTHDNVMKIINPVNKNMIVGESTNPQFSRGGRFKAILMDEFPYWPYDYQAFTASGQSSPCRVLVGTPYGKQNKFAQLRFSHRIAVKTLHWRLHPLKDDTWYQNETKRMSSDEVARELDINYQLSVSNRVFKEFTQYHISDMLVPVRGKKIIRSWDFGYHCPACLVLQLDSFDRIVVLKEFVGSQIQLTDFAKGVLQYCETALKGFDFEDLCDPAGAQKSDKSTQTSIEILQTLGIFPYYNRSAILDGIQLIRHKLTQQLSVSHHDEVLEQTYNSDNLNNPDPPANSHQPMSQPMMMIHQDCTNLIEAFQGGYRYSNPQSEKPLEVHPYEDVMDCLRYAVVHKCGLPVNYNNRQPSRHRYRQHNQNPYTGY